MSVSAPPRPADTGAEEVLSLARGGAVNLAGMAIVQGVGFALTLVLARSLGTRAVGLYSQAFAFLALLELLSLSGFRSGLTRFVAVHLADNDRGGLRGTLRLGMRFSIGSSAVLAGGLWLASPWLARAAFDDAGLEPLLRIVALTLPCTVLSSAALSATQGFRTMKYFAGIGMCFTPLLRLALAAGLLLSGHGLRGVFLSLLISEAAGALLAVLALRHLVGRITEPPTYSYRELFGYSAASWLSSLASTGLIWADTLILGLYMASSDVGRYQVAGRLMMFAAIAMWPVNSAFAPRIAHLHRVGDHASLQRSYAVATSWILRISLPAFIVLAVFPDQITPLFGPGFAVGSAVMAVLVIGKLTDAITGPCGLMLNQSGRVVLNMADNLGVLALNVVLNVALIPRWGIFGSAFAWCVSLVAVNIARMVQVKGVLGMWPVDAASLRGLAAAGAALVAALTVQGALDGTVALVAGGVAVVGVYVGALFALGVSDDDRLIARNLLPARGGQRPGPGRPTARQVL